MTDSGSAPTLLSPERRTTRRTGAPEPLITSEELAPQRIGRYVLLRVLGEGGMGVVHIATDEWLDRKVAIKLLRHSGGGAAAHVRMLREAQALARLAHPNVVTIHDVGEVDGQIYIAMEFVTGVTLRTWLKEQVRSQAEILDVFTQAGRGLAAAHAAGLIHRDVKPDNIMIGGDARVRVMDFGLARTPHGLDDPAHDHDARRDSASMLAAEVTVAGAIVGTPAYMAPEQLLGAAADERSDVYAFCVALYEALYAVRPFPDGPDSDTPRAALQREVLPNPTAAHVPAWLRDLVLRGLAFAPEKRWPSLAALLVALGRDPIAARRRALRTAGLAVLVASLAVAVSLLAVHLQRRWARERADQLADQRLAAVDAAAARATAEGRPAAAEAMFHAFVDDPEHRGTAALARAWRGRGDQLRAAGGDALAAYARAYVEAHAPSDGAAALRAMAAVFHDDWNGPALVGTVAALRARGVDDDATTRLAAFADLRVRELAGAADELARFDTTGAADLFRTLAAARPTDVHADTILDRGPGHAPRFLALAHGNQRVDLLDDDLRRVGSWSSGTDVAQLVPGTTWAVAHGEHGDRLFDVLAPAAPLWRSDSPIGMFRTRGVDLDRDGAAELLFSRAAPSRGFRVVAGIGGPDPREQPADPATDQVYSDIDAIVADDLDGDGRLEIVVAAGAWMAHDVRVLRVDDAGRLTLVSRRRTGRVGALTVVGRGPDRRILAIKDDLYPNPRVFPIPPHTGPLAGVYRLRWTGDELVDDGFVPLPRSGDLARYSATGSIHAGDLDGDGVDEAVAKLDASGGDMAIVRQLPDDRLDLQIVANLWPLRLAQLDADPALELIVGNPERTPAWILGAGDQTLPGMHPAPLDPRPPPPALTDPLLALRWTRADELATIGLPAGAADSLQDAANLTSDPDARRELLARAAALRSAAGDDAAALEIGRALPVTAERLARDISALARLGRHDEAHARADELLARPDATPAQRAEAAAQRARLGPLVGAGAAHELRFDAPLADHWQVLRPAGVRRNPATRTLELATFAEELPVARVPLQWSGGPLQLDAELTLDRVEYGACMRVSILDEAGRSWLGAGVCGIGGGGRVTAALNCQSPGIANVHDLGAALAPGARVRLRFTWFADESFECTLDHGDTTVRRRLSAAAGPPPGRYWLALGAMPSDDRSNLAVGAIRRLTVRGAPIAAAVPPDLAARAATRLAEGDPAGALVLLGQLPADDRRRPLWQALAHADRNDLAGVVAAIDAVSLDMSDKTWADELALLLRTRPTPAAALRRRLGPAALPLLDDVYTALAYQHRDDPVGRELALAALGGVEAITPTTDRERTALRNLLATRAVLWTHLGELARARRDREAALAVPPVDSPDDALLRADQQLQLAQQLVADDPAAALAYATAAVAVAPSPALVRMRLADDPALAALADDPAWRPLLRLQPDPPPP